MRTMGMLRETGFANVRTRGQNWSAGLATALVLAAVSFGPSPVAQAKTNNPPAHVKVDDSAIDRNQRAPLSFSPVVKKVAPSVVNIYSTMTIHERTQLNPFFSDPFFRRFFGDEQPTPRSRKAQSLGSGVIVSPDGYILTANHVVAGADAVKVALASGEKEYDAKVIGTDPPTDVAVLRIDAKGSLPAITLGDSDKLEVGDTVLAVGNPFAVGQTVTMGIISGLERGGFGITGYENFIQTDAAINPGNSGGALVDSSGRLVGINTAILSRSGGFQGVGFAVPINMARFVMDRLIASGKVTRGFLGVDIQTLSPDLAKEFDLPDESSGVLIGGVSPNSPAARAGIHDGDIITQFNGKKVTDPRSLQLMTSQTAPGTKVNVTILRGEPGHKPAQQTVSVTLGQLPQEAVAGQNRGPSNDNGQQSMDALEGVEVTDIDADARRQFGIPRAVQGALVVSVDEGSAAAEAGLRPGDVMVEINRQRVRNAEEAVSISQKIKGDRILLRVWSKAAGGGSGGTHYIVVENAPQK